MTANTRIIEKTPSAYGYPLLIKHLLHFPTVYTPQKEIVYRDKARYDYYEFFRRISRLASGLSALGVKPGDVVAVLDWDSHRYLECYFAVPMLGAVLHTVNIRLSPAQILYTMNHAGDTVVLVHEDFLPMLEGIKDELKTVRRWILLKDDDTQSNTSVPVDVEYEQLLAKGSDHYDFDDFDENSMATLFYTTGTTGDPKGVYFSHRQLFMHTMMLSAALGSYHAQGRFRSNDVYMPLTPMFHVHAWGLPYVATFLGVKQVYPGRYEPDAILRLVDKEKVTFSHCVPTILHMLLQSLVAKEVDLSKWKLLIGGSAFPRGLAKAALEAGIDITTGYGMSETCPVLSLALLKPDELDADLDWQVHVRTSTGLPAPLVDLHVVGPDMKDVTPDGRTTGEIVVRAPWLTQGYYENPEASEDLWRGGYMHTGDVACIDSEGYIRITDRLKDVIKSGGEWISSLELESVISEHPGVGEAAVVGRPDDRWGERPVALVVPSGGMRDGALKADLHKFLKKASAQGRISKWAVPDEIKVVEAIPKTSVGKIDKKLIRLQTVA
ncbi:MAG TPA: fatty acid--CoA ligase [Desulfomonilaceae bacterium]|nr:fatty acid--CoA ligase [Desulfomonilaceae bacterium]